MSYNQSDSRQSNSSNDSLNLDDLFSNVQQEGSGQELAKANPGERSNDLSSEAYHTAQESLESFQSLPYNSEPSQTPFVSSPRARKGHEAPFPDLQISRFEGKGPKDPNQQPGREVRVPARFIAKPDKSLDGLDINKEPFFTSNWPGVTWHEGIIKKQKGNINIVARLVNKNKAYQSFIDWTDNEKWAMEQLNHRYILNCIGWHLSLNEMRQRIVSAVFPKCESNLENHVRPVTINRFRWKRVQKQPLNESKVKQYMGQVAQALAYLHEKNLVHTRIHPSSIRLHGSRHVKLSRLMCVQKWSETRTIEGKIPKEPHHYFFISPERFSQQVSPELLNQLEDQEILQAEISAWNGKKDDVWAFGCVTFFLLTAKYPFRKRHSNHRSLLKAFKENFLTTRIQQWPTLTADAREFLLWILKPNQNERPTMDQVVNHQWLQHDNPTSPDQQDFLTENERAHRRTFKRISGHIDENLVAEMAKEGFAIQHLIGQGGFGAVYKGMWQNKVTGERIPIAMKVIKGNKRNTTFKIHRWSTEQKAMTFEHPNLVKIYKVFKEIKRPQHQHSIERRVFIFMELATMDLGALTSMKGAIDEQKLNRIMSQVVQGLAYLHKHNVVHRDIKPENILILENGHNGTIAKLTDYSLVREADNQTISTSFIGTGPYMAPELHLNGLIQIADVFKLDVWALGITIYECLQGEELNWSPRAAAEAAFHSQDITIFVGEHDKMLEQVQSCGKSDNIIDLLTGMLGMYAADRFSLKEVQEHPWFTKSTKSDE